MQGSQYFPMITAAAGQYHLPAALLAGLIQQESSWNPRARSSSGAMGLGQFMPGTAKQYGVNVNDPKSSIMGAAHFLSNNLKMFGGNQQMALAAYNAGPGAVQQYGGIPPYAETQNYVKKIQGYQKGFAGAFGQPQGLASMTPQMKVTGRLAGPDEQVASDMMPYGPPQQQPQPAMHPAIAQAIQQAIQPPNQPAPQATQSMIDGTWNTPQQTQYWNQQYANQINPADIIPIRMINNVGAS